jgi:hypothetical protein
MLNLAVKMGVQAMITFIRSIKLGSPRVVKFPRSQAETGFRPSIQAIVLLTAYAT